MSTAPFPDNSDKSKNPETTYNKVKATPAQAGAPDAPKIDDSRPKVGRIVSGSAIKRSTPLGTKIKNFFVGDSAHNILEYVLLEVLIPAAKEAAADAVTQGVEKRLFGDVRSVSRRTGTRPGGLSSNSNGPKVHYDRPGLSNARAEVRPVRRGGKYDIGQIVIPTRAEATEILEMMFSIVNQYEVVTVRELYEMAGVASEYTDQRWGWTNLRGATAQRVRDGYLLDLPTPEALD
jgi:hypothetical protein